jgi:hypothetical protein
MTVPAALPGLPRVAAEPVAAGPVIKSGQGVLRTGHQHRSPALVSECGQVTARTASVTCDDVRLTVPFHRIELAIWI